MKISLVSFSAGMDMSLKTSSEHRAKAGLDITTGLRAGSTEAMTDKKKILVATFPSLKKDSAAGIGRLAYLLSATLDKEGLLDSLIVSSKGQFSTTFPSRPVSFWSRYYLYLINRFGKHINLRPYISRYIQELLYDWYCRHHVHPSLGALVTTNPYLYRTFLKARKWGIPIYLIPGNPEDNYIRQLVEEENSHYGITEKDAYTYQPRLDYYNKSLPLIDRFIIYSSLMEDSYRHSGHGERIISTRGYLQPNFSAIPTQKKNGSFRVCFLAHIVLLKGLQYLLEAWKELQDSGMELHIGGTMDKNVQAIIDRDYAGLRHITYHGMITDIPAFFADKSLYILTSIVDGAPVTVLEAMHCSLPVIATTGCGTKDIIETGVNGWVIPIRDVAAIRDSIREAFADPARTEAMGRQAQTTISNYRIAPFVQQLAAIVSGRETIDTTQ